MWILFNLITTSLSLVNPGKPSVPVIRKLIQGDTTGIDIVVSYAESTAKIEIPPAPYPVLKKSNKPMIFRDPSVYEKDAFYPERPYKFYYLGRRRGVKYFILEVHPYLYNPVKNKIRYAESIDIRGTEVLKYKKQEDKDTLLIVTPLEFLPSLNYFLFYKRICGFSVEILVTDPSWDINDIKNEISLRNPDYLLIIGDISKIPAFSEMLYIPGNGGDHRLTDLYYACSDSDYIPDIFYGRISVDDVNELSDIIDKILNYDSLNYSWGNKAFFMASDDATWFTLAEMTQNYSMEKVRQNGMIADSHFARRSTPGTPLDEAFSSGISIAAYSGHGSNFSWRGPSFDTSDVNNLPPNFRTPVIFSFACNTGAYGNNNDCFMEHWNLSEKKGSIISFGSSTGSYWDEDDLLQRSIFDVLFDDKRIGALIDTAKLLFASKYSGDSILIKSYYQQYNLLGDPTLKLRYGNYEKTILDIPRIVSLKDTITANIGSEGKVGLFQNHIEEIYDVDNSGSVKLSFSIFYDGAIRIMAKAKDKLSTSKLMYISDKPISDVFHIENNLTVDIFRINFFAIPGKVDASLYDCLGRKIEEKSWKYNTYGKKSELWDIKDIKSGIYFIEVSQGKTWRFTGKIIKL
jgi:hypothetical protein